MKRTVLIAFLLLMIPMMSRGQAPIPNGDFESWTGNSLNGWFTSNIGKDDPVKPTTDAYSGKWAFHGAVIQLSTGGQEAPIAISGTSPIAWGTPYSEKPKYFTGYYKYSGKGSDKMVIYAGFRKGGSGLAVAEFNITQDTSIYTPFTIAINWPVNSMTPDSVYINMTILGYNGSTQTAHLGSEMFVDDLKFTNTLGVASNLSASFALAVPMPNPAIDETTIGYTLDRSGLATLSIYDVTGKLVARPISEFKPAGTYATRVTVGNLPSGVYFYRLTNGDRSLMHQMQVVR
jgi:hypothetical protein